MTKNERYNKNIFLSDKKGKDAIKLNKINYRKKFRSKKQKELLGGILENRITFVSGPAGTGKTYVALMSALRMLIQDDHNIYKMTITKPIIESTHNSLGYLKGGAKDKTEPYFVSFYDNLEKLIDKDILDLLIHNGYINEVILNFVRGNTFGDVDKSGKDIGHIAILDEAQNTTVNELKTFISRMGEETKLIILGDIDQMDLRLKKGEINGLEWAFEYLKDIDGIFHYEFTEDDIIRSKFLVEIMKRFKEYENKN